MFLRVTPTYTFVDGRIPIDVWQALHERLSYSRDVYGWVKGRGKCWQSLRVSLLGYTDGVAYFPTGLLPRVQGLFGAAGLAWFEEPDVLPPLCTALRNGMSLYEDQVEAGQAALAKRRGLLAVATNFGKTPLQAALLLTLPTAPALLLLNQKELARQTARDLEAMTGERVTLWGAGARKVTHPTRITVATIQALYLRRHAPAVQQWLGQVEVLLVDEVHTVSPLSWYPILELCTKAWFRMGLSGTVREVPYPLAMEAFFGPIIHEVLDATLIQQGRSAATTVLMPRIGNMLDDDKDYDRVYRRGIVGSTTRNQVLARFAATAANLQLPTLVSFYFREHGEALERLCREDYLGPVYRLDGRAHPRAVEEAVAKAAAGKPGIYLLGIGYNKGMNLPGARVLVNAAAWRSPLTTSQRSGRVIRKKLEGGNWAVVIDPMDLGNITLKHQGQEREKTYLTKGFLVEVDNVEVLLGRLAELAAQAAQPAAHDVV